MCKRVNAISHIRINIILRDDPTSRVSSMLVTQEPASASILRKPSNSPPCDGRSVVN